MRKTFVLSLALFVLAASPAAKQSSNANQRPLVFTHVTVIDASGGPAHPETTVVITGDRIREISTFYKGESQEKNLPGDRTSPVPVLQVSD